MNLKNYPYGKTTKTLKDGVGWLRKNKKHIEETQYDYFDYPNYWDMPTSICDKLSSDEVDWLQEETWGWFKK